MTKLDILEELNKRNIKAKVRFYKKRLEAWIYPGNTPAGILITEEIFSDKEYLQTYLDVNL